MTDFLKRYFNPAKQASGAMGNIGGALGSIGGRYGHLGAKYGDLGASQQAFNPKDHFNHEKMFNIKAFFDPIKEY